MFVRQSYIYSKTLTTGTGTAQFVSRKKKNQQGKNTSLFQENHCLYKNLAKCMAGEKRAGGGEGERKITETETDREREREKTMWQQN
jgi:hypothetical protein